MIKAVIFDVGGVLVNKSPVLKEILDEFNLMEKEIYVYYLETLRKLEAGEIDEPTFWELFTQRFGVTKPVPKPSPLIKRYKEEIKINKDTVRVKLDLKRKGFKLAVLSNTIPPHADYLKKLGVFENLDVVILSNEVGFLKPNPAIYKITLEKLSVKPEEAIFIDDDPSYVKAAEQLGIKSFVFTKARDLEKDLKEIKLL